MVDQTQPAPAAGEAPARPDHARIDHAIEVWFHEHIDKSPVACAGEAYAHLVSVLGHLKAKLISEA